MYVVAIFMSTGNIYENHKSQVQETFIKQYFDIKMCLIPTSLLPPLPERQTEYWLLGVAGGQIMLYKKAFKQTRGRKSLKQKDLMKENFLFHFSRGLYKSGTTTTPILLTLCKHAHKTFYRGASVRVGYIPFCSLLIRKSRWLPFGKTKCNNPNSH